MSTDTRYAVPPGALDWGVPQQFTSTFRWEYEDGRAQLLALARKAFSDRSYDDVSIDDLAREAKISKGLLYHYFPTKRDLYVAGLREIADELVARCLAIPANLAPIDRVDAQDMIDDLRTQEMLGAFRGEPALDREALASLLVGLAEVPAAEPDVRSIDLNPLIVRASDGRPVAVDALVRVLRP